MWWLLACGAPGEVAQQAVVEVAARNPLLDLDRAVDTTPWRGTVRQTRDAGYAYQRIDDVWTVSLGDPLPVGTPVEVRPVGLARGFHSRRTGDDYDELWFAVVKSMP
ncbi:MAG: hypothetical protein R3F59_33240 [Myxococcota bacterium]